MPSRTFPNEAIELRATAVFFVFSVASDGLSGLAAPARGSKAPSSKPTTASGNSSTGQAVTATMWVDDQYDKKENMSYEFDELMQFARNRVLNPHEDMNEMSAAAKEALKMAQAEAASRKSGGARGINAFPENWGMSQFWYTPETQDVIANAISEQVEKFGGVTAGLKIAILSTPSVFLRLQEQGAPYFDDCINFEFDRRFEVFGHQFEFFDFQDAHALMEKYDNYFDLVYIDPPFREEVCVEKNIEIAKAIVKKNPGVLDGKGHIIFCTGLMFEDRMETGLGAKLCRFCPEHTNKLSNPTRCFTTFPCPALN